MSVTSPVLALDDVLDRHGDRVRQLVADALERRLADDLRDAVLERLVGHHAFAGRARGPTGMSASSSPVSTSS